MWARASRAIQRFRVAWCSGESMSYRTASVSVNWVTTQIEIEREATTKTTCWWIRKKFIEKSFDRDEKLLVFLLDRQSHIQIGILRDCCKNKYYSKLNGFVCLLAHFYGHRKAIPGNLQIMPNGMAAWRQIWWAIPHIFNSIVQFVVSLL